MRRELLFGLIMFILVSSVLAQPPPPPPPAGDLGAPSDVRDATSSETPPESTDLDGNAVLVTTMIATIAILLLFVVFFFLKTRMGKHGVEMNAQQKHYLELCKQQGHSKEEVSEILLQSGYSLENVNKMLKNY